MDQNLVNKIIKSDFWLGVRVQGGDFPFLLCVCTSKINQND